MPRCSHCGLDHSLDDAICPITEESLKEPGPCGSRIDRYEVEKWLGGGGFGAVYRARHVVMDRPVALKLLHARYGTTPRALERFFQEAKAAAAIGHPSIVQVYDAGTTADDTAFLAMELVDGCSLHELIDVDKLPMRRAVAIALQVLDALAAAHRSGIIHRDVKPGNIMLGGTTPDGEESDDRVKLVDFGISKVRKVGDAMELTRSNIAMGSPGYAAPEQYVSARDVDARADVYGVGVVLYRLLTGELPFAADSYEQMVVRVCTADPAPLATRNPDLPKALCAVVDRAIARDREARHPSAQAFAEALRAIAHLAPDERPFGNEPSDPYAATLATDGTGPNAALPVSVRPTQMRSEEAATSPRPHPDDATTARRASPAADTPTTRVGASTNAPAPRTGGARLVIAAVIVAVAIVTGAGLVVALRQNDGTPPDGTAAAPDESAPRDTGPDAPTRAPPVSSGVATDVPDGVPSAVEPVPAEVTGAEEETSEGEGDAENGARRRKSGRRSRTAAMAALPPTEAAPAEMTDAMRSGFGTEDLEPF